MRDLIKWNAQRAVGSYKEAELTAKVLFWGVFSIILGQALLIVNMTIRAELILIGGLVLWAFGVGVLITDVIFRLRRRRASQLRQQAGSSD